MSEPEQEKRPSARPGRSMAHENEPVALTLEIDLIARRLGKRMQPGERSSATLAVKLPDQSTRQLIYNMGNELLDQLNSIEQRYARDFALTESRLGDLRLHDHGTGVKPDHADGAKSDVPVLTEVNQILRLQQFLEMALTLRERPHQAAGTDLDAAYDQVMEGLNTWYSDSFRVLRGQLRTHPAATEIVRDLLRSGSEVLIDIGVRLASEPTLRTALQEDLIELYQKRQLSSSIRQRAFAILSVEERQRLAEPTSH